MGKLIKNLKSGQGPEKGEEKEKKTKSQGHGKTAFGDGTETEGNILENILVPYGYPSPFINEALSLLESNKQAVHHSAVNDETVFFLPVCNKESLFLLFSTERKSKASRKQVTSDFLLRGRAKVGVNLMILNSFPHNYVQLGGCAASDGVYVPVP